MILMVAIALAAAPAPDYLAFSDLAKLVAVAATSAGSCPRLGYAVDAPGARQWAERASSEGVYGGMSASSANMILADALSQETANLEALNARVKASGGNRREIDRLLDFWAARCAMLAENPHTSAYFRPQ